MKKIIISAMLTFVALFFLIIKISSQDTSAMQTPKVSTNSVSTTNTSTQKQTTNGYTTVRPKASAVTRTS